jgi:protein SDA1
MFGKFVLILYSRNDSKTVNVIAEACFSSNLKVVSVAVQFFLGSNEKQEEEDQETIDLSAIRHAMSVNRKTKSKKVQYEKVLSTMKKKERSKNKAEVFNFSALHLINDPQGFTEKLFSRLKSSSASIAHKFELRLEMLNLVTRMIGVHKLIVLGLYEFLMPYLKPTQREVTKILAYAAQASHDLVPPDALEPVIQGIADKFVWSNCASEVVVAG